jgi:hypothetical protein
MLVAFTTARSITFRATTSPPARGRARYTVANEPLPIAASTM